MLSLSQVTLEDLTEYARKLYLSLRDKNETFEGVAQELVRRLYDEIRMDATASLFSLLRIFRFGPLEDLPAELRQQATAENRYWLALAGTVGVEQAWCNRRTSEGHRVIPADSYATPMLRAAFEQIGLKFGDQIQANTQLTVQSNPESPGGFFFVPTAFGSPHIPDQEFVRKYGIQSVLGIGAPFRDNRACICIGFTRQAVSAREAEKWSAITPYVMTLLSAHNEPNKIWS